MRLSDHQFLIEINLSWPLARDRLVSSTSPVNDIRGIMSNMIFILISAKWSPVACNAWRDHEGTLWVLNNSSVSPDIVASAICKSHFLIDLRRAASHHNGAGLQNGIDYNTTMRWVRNLDSNYYNFKCALETIIAAGSWPNA